MKSPSPSILCEVTMFLNLASSAAIAGTAIVSDLLGLATRPVVLLGQAGIAPETAAAFATGGIVTGIIGTVSVLLVGVGLGALFHQAPRPVACAAASLYLIDSIFCMPQLLLPYGDAAVPIAACTPLPRELCLPPKVDPGSRRGGGRPSDAHGCFDAGAARRLIGRPL